MNHAIRHERVDSVQRLIDRGYDLNSRVDETRRTPLMVAASEGNKKIVELLADNGADMNLQDRLGYTALHWAAYYNCGAVAEALAKRGASLNIEERKGFTPLILAAYYGHLGVVKALVEGGARTDIEDKRGQTALDYAKQGGFSELEEYLVKAQNSGAAK
ncbi:MAG TPA: ankyrin repeat domain-containing protein [bacterium]